MKTIGIIALSLLAFVGLVALVPGGQTTISAAIDAVTMRLNTNPPAYIKEVVAYKEGDGLVIYFTLADASGAFTGAEGTATVTIREELNTLWSRPFTITRTDFHVARVGRGAFERSTLVFMVGRIAERELNRPPAAAICILRPSFGPMRERS